MPISKVRNTLKINYAEALLCAAEGIEGPQLRPNRQVCSFVGQRGKTPRHAVGESNLDLEALLCAAEGIEGPGIIVPTRNTELLRWCLESGMRVVQPMSLMTIGLYNQPSGAYLTSILF